MLTHGAYSISVTWPTSVTTRDTGFLPGGPHGDPGDPAIHVGALVGSRHPGIHHHPARCSAGCQRFADHDEATQPVGRNGQHPGRVLPTGSHVRDARAAAHPLTFTAIIMVNSKER